MTVLTVAAFGLCLAACASTHSPVLSIAGACKAFDAPKTEVAGRASSDQRWINGQVEAGVGACGWQRPAPRPVVRKLVTKAPPMADTAEEPLVPSQPAPKVKRHGRIWKLFHRKQPVE